MPTLFNTLPAVISVLSILIFSACSGRPDIEVPDEIASLENLNVFPADAEPAFELILARETAFGDTDDVLLGSWLSAAVDDEGRVFLADHQETVIHLYNADGTYNRQIGREGEGPGEYRQIGTMKTDGRYLHIMDGNLSRITRYDLNTFEVMDDLPVPRDENPDGGPAPYPGSFDLTPDGNYLVHFGMGFWSGEPEADDQRRKTAKILNRSTGKYEDQEIYTFPESESLVEREGSSLRVMGVPYKHNSVVAYTEGQLVYGFSDHFLLKFYDLNGQYLRAVYYPFPEILLSRDRVLEDYADRDEPWRGMVRRDEMPETWPAFDTFYTDDEGRIWVKMFTEDPDTSQYAVLGNSGELLASFTRPREQFIQQIKNGYLYLMEEDEMGLREIVRYRIDLRDET